MPQLVPLAFGYDYHELNRWLTVGLPAGVAFGCIALAIFCRGVHHKRFPYVIAWVASVLGGSLILLSVTHLVAYRLTYRVWDYQFGGLPVTVSLILAAAVWLVSRSGSRERRLTMLEERPTAAVTTAWITLVSALVGGQVATQHGIGDGIKAWATCVVGGLVVYVIVRMIAAVGGEDERRSR